MAKTMTGSRAKIYVDDQLVGIFESCSWGVGIGLEPIHILGRFGAAEIVETSYEPVSVNCGGFRIIGQGAHKLPKVPKLQDLLNLGYVTIAIVDRQTGENIMTVAQAKPMGYDTGVNAKATSRLNVRYLGLKVTDEEGDQDEPGASDLP